MTDSNTHRLLPPRLIVCGAGLGGLTFVLSLQKACRDANVAMPHVDLLERVANADAKMTDSYSISIRADTGATDVFKKIELLEKLEGLQISPSTGMFMAMSAPNAAADVMIAMDFKEWNVPSARVPRCRLWKMLLDEVLKVENVDIHWGADVVQVVPSERDVSLLARDGRKFVADICVAADGNRSNVRQCLFPEQKPQFTGLTLVSATVDVPALPDLLQHKFGLIAGLHGSSLFMSPESPTSVNWALSWRETDPAAATAAISAPDAFDKAVARVRRDFGEPFVSVVERTTPQSEKRRLVGFDKAAHASLPNVIFIGDATHAVTPMSGNGAGMAIVDAHELAELLVAPRASSDSLAKAVAAFDKVVARRADQHIAAGRRNIKMMHAEGALLIWRRNAMFRGAGWALAHPKPAAALALVVAAAAVVGVGFAVVQTIKRLT